MVRKSLYDSNDVNKDNGVDDVKVSFYKIQKEVMYIEVTVVQECFKKFFFYISYNVGSYYQWHMHK